MCKVSCYGAQFPADATLRRSRFVAPTKAIGMDLRYLARWLTPVPGTIGCW